jgi:hypothetical protein
MQKFLEPKIAQKCELSDESATHHFHSASKTSSQDATFFAGSNPASPSASAI